MIYRRMTDDLDRRRRLRQQDAVADDIGMVTCEHCKREFRRGRA